MTSMQNSDTPPDAESAAPVTTTPELEPLAPTNAEEGRSRLTRSANPDRRATNTSGLDSLGGGRLP